MTLTQLNIHLLQLGWKLKKLIIQRASGTVVRPGVVSSKILEDLTGLTSVDGTNPSSKNMLSESFLLKRNHGPASLPLREYQVN